MTFASPHLRAILSGTLLAASLPAAAQSQRTVDDTLRFEVVSIRPSGATAKETHIDILPDGYEAIGLPLNTTLLIAYAPAPFFAHLDDVKGAPSWVSTERYDIRAKLPAELAARWKDLRQNIAQTPLELQSMLRIMLAERCKLRIHSTPSQADAYAVRIQSRSPALVESTALPPTERVMQLPDGAKAVFSTENGIRTYEFFNTSMPSLVSFLSLQSSRTVVDETGLTGRYHFILHRIQAAPVDGEAAQVDVPVPFDLQTVGIKATHTKTPSTIWIVDSIERPTEN